MPSGFWLGFGPSLPYLSAVGTAVVEVDLDVALRVVPRPLDREGAAMVVTFTTGRQMCIGRGGN